MFLENADAFSAGKINPTLELLAELFVEDIKQCELSVEGREFTETGAGKHELKRKDDDGGCTWNLLTTTATGASQEWGVFRLEGQELKFQWKGKPSVRLQFCRLNIKVGDQAVRCSLNRVEKLTRVPINVEEPFTVPLKCLTGVLRKDDPVRIELQFDGLTSSISVNGEKRNSMKPGEIAEIRVRNPDVKSDDSLASTVAMEIAFRAPQANSLTGSSIPPSLRGEVYGFPRSPIENRRMSLSLNEKSDAMKALRALGTAADVTFSQDHPTQRDWLARWSKVDAKDRERAVEYFRLGWDSFQAQNQNAPKERIESFSKRIKEFPEKDKAQETIKRNAIDDKKLAAAEEYEKVYRFKVSHEAWCEAMKAFLAGELSKGKIHYRVYMDFEGDPIDIAKTDGFPGKA
ncbi:MAG: hypothetical protein NTY19_03460 [Planctomycetota bacterium]|nr:hypothetical protein [Planctomycetota bacterium]